MPIYISQASAHFSFYNRDFGAKREHDERERADRVTSFIIYYIEYES